MTIVMRPSCWHKKFGPNGLSAPAQVLCLNFFSSITVDFNIPSALRWAIQDQWSSGFMYNGHLLSTLLLLGIPISLYPPPPYSLSYLLVVSLACLIFNPATPDRLCCNLGYISCPLLYCCLFCPYFLGCSCFIGYCPYFIGYCPFLIVYFVQGCWVWHTQLMVCPTATD